MFVFLFFAITLGLRAYAQSSSPIATSVIPASISPPTETAPPSGSGISYISYTSTITLSSLPNTQISVAIPSATVSSTSMPTLPPNQPCNNDTAFCSRSYSNPTYIGAHNSPFSLPNNAFSNQNVPVLTQLASGIRLLQGQTHLANSTLSFCHTSCSYLNAGPVSSYFATVAAWLAANPYEVLTLLLINGDFLPVQHFTGPLEASGLAKYAYTPAVIPLVLSDWPTLGKMILSGQRVVIFMDYGANQSQVPYILDEFSQLWETPYDPTNQGFPCTVQRPPGLSEAQAEGRMFLSNHNLNKEVKLLGTDVPVPDTMELNVTNARSGFGSLGLAAENCVATWGRPPNFVLVDYYNNPNGSVFEVAAELNSVATQSGTCCVPTATPQTVSGAKRLDFRSFSELLMGILCLVCFLN